MTSAEAHTNWRIIGLKGMGKTACWSFVPRRSDRNIREFNLRKPVELNAWKLYFLFVAARNNATNLAHIGYDKIFEHTGVATNKIRHSISVFATVGLVYIEHVPSKQGMFGISNAYRLIHLDSYRHMGTTGRGMMQEDIAVS